MLIREIYKDPGLYVCVEFDMETLNNFEKYLSQYSIPNETPISKLHTTIIFSEKYVNFPPEKYEETIDPESYDFELFGEDKNCLVLTFESEKLTERWKKATDAGALFKFDTYVPHVTLSYNIEDFDIEKLSLPTFQINIVNEIHSAMDSNWIDNIKK